MTQKLIQILHRKTIRDEFYIYWQQGNNSQALLSLGKEEEVFEIILFVLGQNPLYKTCAKTLFPMVKRENLGFFFDNTKKEIKSMMKDYIFRYTVGVVV